MHVQQVNDRLMDPRTFSKYSFRLRLGNIDVPNVETPLRTIGHRHFCLSQQKKWQHLHQKDRDSGRTAYTVQDPNVLCDQNLRPASVEEQNTRGLIKCN